MTSNTVRNVRRRLSPEARKAEITDAAGALIAEKGYWGLTFADLAKAAGMSVQGILHHFPSKDDLIVGVLSRRDDIDWASALPSDQLVRDVEEFLAVMDLLVQRNAARRELIQLYTVLAAESLNPAHPAHAYFAQRYTRGIDAFASLAQSWHPDPQQLGFQVLCALDGLQINWLRDPDLDLLEQWRVWAKHYFHSCRLG